MLSPHSSVLSFVSCSIAGLLSLSQAVTATAAESTPAPRELFYLSANHGTTADIAAEGTAKPNFDAEVTTIPDGASGPALRCGNFQRLAWSAPGNIYAQRGTLSFFWRAREPVGPTEFPIFRVAFADHSSWDMVWLRIDYNGHGFDAFVTDTNLARTRVSVTVGPFPKPDQWIHLTLSWDETRGIRFYVDGKLAAKKETVAVYDTGLDQFGPHSRIISPHQVQSDYNFTRGGDIDEIRIFDRMLDDESVASLAKNEPVSTSNDRLAEERLWAPRVAPTFGDQHPHPAFAATIAVRPPAPIPRPEQEAARVAFTSVRDEWYLRYGWTHLDAPPPVLPARYVAVRKVEIHDAYDQKRWWWKATDGLRETTWPGVYNRSRLPGRNDYFQLPDWDCYSTSGKSITFTLPEEPWNQIEIYGAAWGRMTLGPDDASPLLFVRPKGEQHTVNLLGTPHIGGKITFTNVEQEEPIGELVALNVIPGTEPTGSVSLPFRLAHPSQRIRTSNEVPELSTLDKFIVGRFPADERRAITAESGKPELPMLMSFHGPGLGLPLVHITIPDTWDQIPGGLDGIAIDLPAFQLAPTHGQLVAFNIQVKDPLWPSRDLMNFSFSLKPGDPHTLWLDLRDRLLPPGQPLYLTIACSAHEFTEDSLYGADIRLMFKPREAARAEHELDRFTQARDAYAMLVEEHPNNPKLNLWVRFKSDLEDLLRVNPDHVLGRTYAAAAGLAEYPPLPFVQPEPPAALAGKVPLWAFRQTELLGRVKRFVNWYIDHRQIENGEFGGGISDDVDLTNTWPGVALMGCNPEKIRRSVHALLEAAFANGMFTRGLPTIQADELHSYEEGINCLAQNMLLEFGSPRQLERAMETTRGVESITGVNVAGHRHIRTSYYSGSKLAEEGPWGWSKPYSYLVLHPAYLLTEYNGNPEAKKLVLELADGLLAHFRSGKSRDGLPSSIQFATDAEGEATRNVTPWPLFWAGWRWTDDTKYLAPIREGGLSSFSTINGNALDLLNLRADWTRRLDAGETTRPTETRRPDGRTHGMGNRSRSVAGTHFAWQLKGDKKILEELYAAQIKDCAALEYINTEGSLWIDRVAVPYTDLQRARLGGVALSRGALFPGHVVSWSFPAPANDQSVAILIPQSSQTAFTVIAHNLEDSPVHATMTGWDVAPGQWEITQGVDTNNDDVADAQKLPMRSVTFERSRSVDIQLPSHATSVLTFKRIKAGTPYWHRPDLGLDREDVTRTSSAVQVKIHGLGSVANPPTKLTLTSSDGRVLGTADIPVIAPPNDLIPKTAVVEIPIAAGESLNGATVTIDSEQQLEEITKANNSVRL